MKQIQDQRPNLSEKQVDYLVEEAEKYDVETSASQEDLIGHPDTGWDEPHIHFGKARIHIPVPKGYKLKVMEKGEE